MVTFRTLVVAVFTCLPVITDAANFLKSGLVSEGDVRGALDAELAGSVRNGRLQQLEESLRATYAALPKNAAGNLGHQAVRYVLHRLFVQRNGWYIRGLEPNNNTWHDPSALQKGLKEWVPSYLQGLLEDRLGERGTNLHELAALAAALEDLIDREAIGRLETAYDLHQLSRIGTISEEEVDDVVTTYYITFLMAGNFSATTKEELLRKKNVFAAKYTGWKEAADWLAETTRLHKSKNIGGHMDFPAVSQMVEEIGERYYRFNDMECRALKSTLRDMEGNKAGRVRLATFYQKALYSHWRFTEKADYLRVLGALDESDPQGLQVIVPNYIMSRPNCLEASNLYAICCRNECEDLMGHLETQIGTAMAEPSRIVALVSALSSDTVAAPRNLSAALVSKLEQVAATHGGKVPLHGRLFAQWMHHAYPRECPYPHEKGTTSPQTPDEWMAKSGQEDSQASAEEMVKMVQADVCVSKSGGLPKPGDCEGSELPWDEKEELLIAHSHAPVSHKAAAVETVVAGRMDDAPEAFVPSSASPSATLSNLGLAFVFAGGVGIFLAADYVQHLRKHRAGAGAKFSHMNEELDACNASYCNVGWRIALAVTALTFLARALDLLDGVAFGLALCGSLAMVAIRHVADRLLPPPAKGDPLSKCCV